MLDHNYIGTEHVLLGLLHTADGVARRALGSLGVSLDTARREVEAIIGLGQAAPTGHIPFTPRAKKVLELAFREALELGHNYIGTEHLLLGLVREGEGVGAQILQKLGADLHRVRQAVIQLLSDSSGVAEMPASEGSVWEMLTREGPNCPSCGMALEGALRYRKLVADPADEGDDPMPILMLFCSRCGAILRSFRQGAQKPPLAQPDR
jgi:ATP-dependent Clp protease ATP-binding subunit ClpA